MIKPIRDGYRQRPPPPKPDGWIFRPVRILSLSWSPVSSGPLSLQSAAAAQGKARVNGRLPPAAGAGRREFMWHPVSSPFRPACVCKERTTKLEGSGRGAGMEATAKASNLNLKRPDIPRLPVCPCVPVRGVMAWRRRWKISHSNVVAVRHMLPRFHVDARCPPTLESGSSFRGKNQGLIDSTTSPGKSQLLPLAQVSLLKKSMGSPPALLSAVAVSHCTCSSFHHSQTMGLLGYGLDAGDGNLTVDLLARNIRTISLGDLSVVGRLKSVPARPRPPVAKASIHIFPP